MTDLLILTYGTAFSYFLKERDLRLVSNCHKTPASHFTKALLNVGQIMGDFEEVFGELRKQNPKINLILTVSPVRHTKDTLALNSVSKSILILSAHYLSEHFGNVHYFPAYEILIDDLRDYRFYKPDLIHPNEMAEKYIFEKFTQTYFSTDLHQFIHEWQAIRTALNHKTLYEGTKSHKKFLKDILKKLQNISQKVDVKNEIEHISLYLAD